LDNIKLWWQETQNIQGIPMYHFQQRLKYIKAKLKKWNKEVFGDIFKDK
jgi:hypothetical protein